MSSKGQIAIPKPIRERLGLTEGTDFALRVDGDEVVLRKIKPSSWRRWEGRFKGSALLTDLAAERRKELKRDAQGS